MRILKQNKKFIKMIYEFLCFKITSLSTIFEFLYKIHPIDKDDYKKFQIMALASFKIAYFFQL